MTQAGGWDRARIRLYHRRADAEQAISSVWRDDDIERGVHFRSLRGLPDSACGPNPALLRARGEGDTMNHSRTSGRDPASVSKSASGQAAFWGAL